MLNFLSHFLSLSKKKFCYFFFLFQNAGNDDLGADVSIFLRILRAYYSLELFIFYYLIL